MVKLTIPSEDILGDNYNITDISVSNYNPTIDGTVTLTVTVKDVYGDAVSGESVLVTASAGNFTKYNGSTITGASSYTGTTNSSGQFTLTYTCSVWGLITFSAKNHKAQISVTGWKQIGKYASDKITLYSDGKWGMVTINGTWSNSTTGENVLATINSEYTPFSNVSTNYSYGENAHQAVYTKGTNICINRSGTGNVGIYCTLSFSLLNPKY